MTRPTFKPAGVKLSFTQRNALNFLGESGRRDPSAVPARLIDSPMKKPISPYEPPVWVAPIR